MKDGVSAKMVMGAKAAEETLARQKAKEVADELPEGHPLKEAVTGDLADLPIGHPLRVAIERAAERYREQAENAEQEGQEEPGLSDKDRQLRRAKKLDRDKARRERVSQEMQERDACRMAAKAVNKGIDDSLGVMRGLYKIMADNEEALAKNQLCNLRVVKLKRLMQAVERGLFDCRMTRV